MIHYDTKRDHSLKYCFARKGSVLPTTMYWSIPATAAAIIFGLLREALMPQAAFSNVSSAWAAYNFTVGFLVVFRTQQAYSRFWEGATLLHKVRGEWVNAVSSLFAFCASSDSLKDDVLKFQHLVVRLMSLMFCKALQRVADLHNEDFPIIDLQGLDPEALRHLADSRLPCEVILQWIQRWIVMNIGTGVLPIPPPILSRVFQELARGIVNLHEAEKIATVLFPFPYAQIMHLLLLVNTFISPIVTAAWTEWYWAGLLTFTCVSSLWAINYIALEIERPFGDDPNDLPIQYLMEEMNRALHTLTEARTQCPPSFDFHPLEHMHCRRELCSRATGQEEAEAQMMWAVSLAEEACRENEEVRVKSLKLKEAHKQAQDAAWATSSFPPEALQREAALASGSIQQKSLSPRGSVASSVAPELNSSTADEAKFGAQKAAVCPTSPSLLWEEFQQRPRAHTSHKKGEAAVGADSNRVGTGSTKRPKHDTPNGDSCPARTSEGPNGVARLRGDPQVVLEQPPSIEASSEVVVSVDDQKGSLEEADSILPSMFVLPQDDPPSQNTDFPGPCSAGARRPSGTGVGSASFPSKRHVTF